MKTLHITDDITVEMPETAEDIYSKVEDISCCILAEDGVVPDPDIIEWTAKFPHIIYLFYLGDELMAMVRLDDQEVEPILGNNAVQIHGATMPKFRGLSDIPSLFILTMAFRKKKTVIAKIDPSNLRAIYWCRRWEFNQLKDKRYDPDRKEWISYPKKEYGKYVFVLKRKDFERVKNVIRI